MATVHAGTLVKFPNVPEHPFPPHLLGYLARQSASRTSSGVRPRATRWVNSVMTREWVGTLQGRLPPKPLVRSLVFASVQPFELSRDRDKPGSPVDDPQDTTLGGSWRAPTWPAAPWRRSVSFRLVCAARTPWRRYDHRSLCTRAVSKRRRDTFGAYGRNRGY